MRKRLVGLGLACFAAALPVHVAAAEIVANETLGIRVAKPDGWHVLTAEANAENLARVRLDDKQMQEAVARYANAPVIAFSKYEEPYEDLNPSFKVTVRPMGALAGRSAVEILDMIVPTLKTTFSDAIIRQPATEVTVSGKPAAYARIDYTLKAGELAFPTASEMWIVPRGSHFFIIGVGRRQDEKNGTRIETQAIVDSIVLTP